VKTPTPHRLHRYVIRCLRLKRYLEIPGDGRKFPQIPAGAMLWAILLGQILRESSFHALERLVGWARRGNLGVSRKFGDDALGYFTERLDPTPTRRAAIQIVRQAKRNKAFQNCSFVGLALDGTTAGRCREKQCRLCRPFRDSHQQIVGYRHHLVMLSVVGTGLSLPIDIEPYGPGDSEYAAGQRLLRRVIPQLSVRFADYLVVDAGFATASYFKPPRSASPTRLPSSAFAGEKIASRSGMPTTSIPGRVCVGPRCASSTIDSTNPTAS
jgi:hypothetical protein